MTYDELKHHGILGMKWGVRRYQNPDGTLTAAGRRRYGGYGLDKAQTQDDIMKGLKKAAKRIRRTAGKRHGLDRFINISNATVDELSENSKVVERASKITDLYARYKKAEEDLFSVDGKHTRSKHSEMTREQYSDFYSKKRTKFDALEKKLREETTAYISEILGDVRDKKVSDYISSSFLANENTLLTRAMWKSANRLIS